MSHAGISIIIPCFNAGGALIEAVNSALSQSARARLEVIVVDDGSTDRATGEALAHATDLPNVAVILLRENKGVQAARNRGLAAARHPFAMMLDADDILLNQEQDASPSYVDAALGLLTDDPSVAFVHTRSRMFGSFSGLTISAYPLTESLVIRKHHVPTSIVFRREDCVPGPGYDPRIVKWQDWSFGVGLLASRWRRGLSNKISFCRGPFHGYRVHENNPRISSRTVDELEMTRLTIESNLDYFQSHFGALDLLELAHRVWQHKPSRLIDLLHMASFDLDAALQVADEREFTLDSPFLPLGIP